MGVTKSIIEDFELSSGVEVYVQNSISGNIMISFDGKEASYNISLKPNEAEKLQELIGVVVQETSK